MMTRYLAPKRLAALTLGAAAILVTGVAPAATAPAVSPILPAARPITPQSLPSWQPSIDAPRPSTPQSIGASSAARPQNNGEDLPPPVATFSIVGYDPETGMIGAAVQSRVFSVGNGVLWGEAGVGMVATQAVVDVSYGPQALELLRQEMAPEQIVETIWERDPDPGYRGNAWPKAGRQFSVMNARGEVATFTGPEASEWAGHVIGENSSAQGNILAGPEVVQDMVSAFESTEGHLAVRLLAALEAGQAAGGDRRGMQSAAMLIVQEDGGVWLNNDVVLRLQVDDSPQPIDELRRLVARALRGPARQGLQTTAIVNGRLFDGTGAAAINDGVVLFEGDRITAVGPAAEIAVPAGARRVDAGGGLIMPGVIDNHMHALWPGSPLTTAGEDTMTPWLQAGVTTLVDTGSIRHTGRAGRALVNAMAHPPRYFMAGPILTVPGGYPTTRREADMPMYAWPVSGAEEAYAVTAELIETEGADLIKVAIETGFDSDYDATDGWPTLSMEELRAIVTAAHERGVMVRAHVTNPGEALAAARAGLDVLAHTPTHEMPDEVLQECRDAGLIFVSTANIWGYPRRERGRLVGPNLYRYHQMGGIVALGTDVPYQPGSAMPIGEMDLFIEAGFTPAEVLVAATRNSARALGMEGELGTLEAGKLADIIVVDGDPLANIHAMANVSVVVRNGEIIPMAQPAEGRE
jgi:uncharacterized Ntn-hydrolase superfamily protein/imidazolonepropionase-like amidohydrolase